MLRALVSATVLVVSLLGLNACGSSASSGAGAPTTPVSIGVKNSADTVTPNGERVKVSVG